METGRKKVLLADDVNLFLELEKTFLRRTDIDILTAGDGRQALELARQHRPQLAFLDLNMPHLDGDRCCRAIKDDPILKEMAVVMVTTAGRPEDIERCQLAGCDGILHKPINRAEFLQVAHSHLGLDIRREVRNKAQVKVLYGPDPQQQLTGFSVNLSTGGIFIETERDFPEDERLTLLFSLPSPQKVIRCHARVAWCNRKGNLKKTSLPSGIGVQFLDLSLEDLHSIRVYLSSSNLEPSW